MAYFKATIEVLVDVEHEADACDCMAEAMRPLLQEFTPTSSVIDWRYAEGHSVPEPDSGHGFEYANDTVNELPA